jgi:nicotinamide mononucleotide adenylyltransferase
MVDKDIIPQLPIVTVHGRFQPPVHINHWDYIQEGFNRAEHVTLLITNPFQDEAYDPAASWRNNPDNNPFTFDERKYMFETLFRNLGIHRSRYDIRPFNIKDPNSFKELDPAVPNLVNVYSEWSEKKVTLFQDHGLPTIRLEMPKTVQVSGTLLRRIILEHQGSSQQLGHMLVDAGLIKQALPGLLAIIESQQKNNHSGDRADHS